MILSALQGTHIPLPKTLLYILAPQNSKKELQGLLLMIGKLNESWTPHCSFIHSKSACIFVIYFGVLKMISMGKNVPLQKKKKITKKNNNNRFETHFSGALSFGVSLWAAFHAGGT